MEANHMEPVFKDLLKKALELKAINALIVDMANIPFNQDFRKLCENNSCGSYDKNWMCPPMVGPIDDLIKRVSSFKQGLLFQTVHQLEDSFDWEGMQEGQANHEKLFRKLLDYVENRGSFNQVLPLNAGPCLYCGKCAYLTGEKCFFPAKAVASVEAYGIDVMALLKNYGIPYSNGPNTVSYVGLIMFKQKL